MTARAIKHKFRLSPAMTVTGTRILLVFLFAYTLVSKLTDLPMYTLTMESQPFPLSLSHVLIWAVPAGEAMACLLLLSDRTVAPGLIIALVMLSSFTVYSALVVSRFYDKVPCPCGGMITGLNWTEHLLMNLFLLTAAIISLRLSGDAKASRNILRNQEKPNTCIKQ